LQFIPRRWRFVARRSRRAGALPRVTLIDPPVTPRRTAMTQRLAARLSAISLAAFMTFAMLGSVNQLANPEPAAPATAAAAAASKPAA